MKRYILGIDNGGTYIKAAIFDEAGRQIVTAKVASPAQNDGKGRSERDQHRLWERNCRCIRQLMDMKVISPSEIACVAFAGQGKGLYAVDAEGGDIRPAITSADFRAKDIAQRWQDSGISDELAQKVCQSIHAYQPVAILRWLKENEAESYRKIRWIFSMKDFLNYRMTGQAATDYSSQSGSPLVNFQTCNYDETILERLDLAEMAPARPPLKWPSEICGFVTQEAHEKTGLAEGTPVAVGMFDVNACALAMGAVADNCLIIITGTWSINAYAAKAPVTDGSIMFNSVYFIPQYYLIEEGSPTSAGVLEWAIGVLYPDEAGKMGGGIYEWLDAIVQKVAPDASDVVFLPFVHGAIRSDRIGGAWMGMNASTRREELLAAVYEGVAFSHRVHVDRLRKNCGAHMRYRLAGGVVNSAVWSQMFSDVLDRPLEVMQTRELGAQGAAISAGIAAGVYADHADAVRRCVHIDRVLMPDPARTKVYAQKYALFQRCMRLALEET